MNATAKPWTAPRKAALALEVLSGRQDTAQAAQRAGLPQSQVEAWVAAARQGMEASLRDEPSTATGAHGDLRDLIRRPFADRDTVTVEPERSLSDAWQLMRREGISQLPVMDGERIVGILDESDVLLHVYGDEERFNDEVAVAMTSKLDVLDVKSPVEALLPVFDRGQVAIVTEGGGERFLGLITRIDLLNYLRRRVP